ncbi:MAG: T9SS C-terminal target domain-containing protein, partial [Bacteroidetes bacterium]
IVDISGRVLNTFENGEREVTLMIPVWDYAPGIYFLEVRNKNQILRTEKIIITR